MGKSIVARGGVPSKKKQITQKARRAGVSSPRSKACQPESLERRLLLSAVSSGVLQGPVSSAATAAWYTSRVAALQSLHSTNQAKPAYTIRKGAGAAPLQTAAPDPAGLSPRQIETYYGFSGLSFGSTPADGRGQTIAVVDAYDDPGIAADLKTFDTTYGLPAPASFSVVSQTGSTTQLPAPDVADPVNGSWALEESLDVQWAHALAPAASIMVVECNSQNDSDLYAGVAYAASAPGVSVVSMSFGVSETNYTPTEVAAIDPTFVTPPGHQGVTFLASSGDQGAYADNGPLAVSFPSSSPGVVAVGGTTVLTDSNENPAGETAWTGSGGGVSTLETQTVAQKAGVGKYSGRAVPDVSFDADPASGVNVVDSLDFTAATPFIIVGGTSFSSPAWGSILAITNQDRVLAGKPTLDGQQQTIPALYSAYTNGSYSSVFKDITTGNNGFYNAVKGYDLVTGLGSPSVQNLVPELATNTVHSTPPVIGGLSISPAAEDVGTSITLTASDLTDVVGNIEGVNFYRVDGSVSKLIGSGMVDAQGNWSITASTSGLSVGTYTYTAVATNNYKQSSAKVSATNKVVVGQATPTIGSFVVQPGTVPVGTSVTMIASRVADTTGPVASVAFYLDTGTAPVLLGQGVDDGYGRWTLPVSTANLVPGTYRFIAIATAASGLVSAPTKAIDKVTVGPPITIVVNTVKDQIDPAGSKTVSLRDAIARADRGIDQVTIEFDPKVFASFQTIVLTGATLSLTNTAAPTIINGPSAGVAVDGGASVEDFSINPGVVVSMSHLTITDGSSAGSGGGLINAGTATLTDVTVSDNTDTGLIGNGGGIENDGTLILIDSTITGNSTKNGNGGGLYNTGTLTATGTTFASNTAFNGAGLGSDGNATLTRSSSSSNMAFNDGGGIDNSGELTLVSSTVSGNTAYIGAGIYSAIGYQSSATAVTTAINTTVAANRATYADGGILNGFGANLVISNSTTAENSAGTSYGGINSEGNTTIGNSIVAGNTAGGGSAQGTDVSGVVISKGHNLVGETDGSSGWTKSDYTGTSSKPLNAQLSPVGNFGGTVETVVPLAGSEAIGHGSISLIASGITTDQRGFARVVGGKVDIGAVEVQGASTLKIKGASSQTVAAGQSTSINLGSFTDSSKLHNGYIVVIDWGDGSADTTIDVHSTGTIAPVSHVFTSLGDVEVSVDVADTAGDLPVQTAFAIKVGPAPRQTIFVNTATDSTDPVGSKTVSLRDAIAQANADYGPVTIEFDPKVFATNRTIKLAGFDLDVTSIFGTVTIAGPAAGVIISGAGTTDVLQVSNSASVSLSNLSIVDGAGSVGGGGITNLGTLDIVDCTISGNTTTLDGGGIDNLGTLNMVNSTLANNTAAPDRISKYPGSPLGGGLYNDGVATLTNVTITGNSAYYGGGIESNYASTLTIANTIVAGNSYTGTKSAADVAALVTSLGHNLIGQAEGTTSSGWIASDLLGTPVKPINAHLSKLGKNGGPTETVVPETGSEALGNGSVSLIPPGITTDQRGKPRTINGKVDIGAVEV